MSDFKCSFCGSDKLMIDTPYIEKTKTWPIEYKKKQTYCCKPQAKNQEYEKRFHPIYSKKPKDVAKW